MDVKHLILALLALDALLLAWTSLSNVAQIQKMTTTRRMDSPTPKLADGCYHVFLDVGANIGVHSRFLLEPNKYPETRNAIRQFDEQFGKDRDNRDMCVFAFEPNPTHRQRLEQVVSAYNAMGWRVEALPAAVGDKDGNITFYHMKDEKYMEWGFTSVRKTDDKGEAAEAVTVPVIRLSQWLLDNIRGREIPSEPYGKYNDGPKVVMKFDVEGMEFVILPDLFLTGALCSTVDYVFGEFHYQEFFYPMKFQEHGLYFRENTEARNFADMAVKLLHVSQDCKTRYNRGPDDETYLKDGIALPNATLKASEPKTN